LGLAALIGGFSSTAMFTLNRKLEQKRLVIIELGSQLAGVAVMVAWALTWRTVWALMMGMVTSLALKSWASHRLLAHKDRLSWDPKAARELVAFGRWIFLSSALAFCGGRLDALVLGKVVRVEDLGLYAIGNNIARLPLELVLALSGAVLFPALSERSRGDPVAFERTLFRARAALLVPALTAATALALMGDVVIRTIYDPRYHAAGWMTRVLAAGQIAGCIGALSGAPLMAVGDSFLAMCLEAVRALLLIGGMLLGNHLYGQTGVIVAVAAVGPLSYPFCAAALARRKLWQPKLDIPLLLVAYGIVAAAFVLR
jgi:O-antigen/teichoic acid export membrane protein